MNARHTPRTTGLATYCPRLGAFRAALNRAKCFAVMGIALAVPLVIAMFSMAISIQPALVLMATGHLFHGAMVPVITLAWIAGTCYFIWQAWRHRG